MNEILSNSYKSKEKETVEKDPIVPITGSVKTKKRSAIKQLIGAILSENIQDFRNYFINDVLAPTITDALHSTIDGLFKSGKTSSARRNSSSPIPYNKYFRSEEEPRKKASSTVYDYVDLVFESYGEAEYVRESLIERIDKYKAVSVADYYEFVGRVGKPIDRKWGWYNLDYSRVDGNERDGWYISLPKATYLD